MYDPEFVFADNVKPVIVSPPARHPFLWIIFFEIGIRKALKREKIDVFLSPDGWLCLSSQVKTINVIHDLNFVHYPKLSKFWYRNYYRFFFPRFARKADFLATVSEFSKQDIVKSYNIDPAKIKVIYNGIADDFFEITEKEKRAIQEELTGGIPYFVFVGTANKRKNVINILRAFDTFRAKDYEAKLVFAGMNKYWDKEMQSFLRSMQFSNDVIFTGYVPTSLLNKIISSSFSLLYPSLFEGFGVPIIEAFACGVPVITSNTTAMPEVAGNAALLIDPLSVEEITNAMERLFTNKKLYTDLIIEGRKRILLFQWTKSSNDLWQIIEDLLTT
jgi:glycosyltransferase involved in cell wall biosynthesis